MITNTLKDKCALYLKTSTPSALGEDVTWSLVGSYWCRKIHLEVETISTYQQLNTQVTDRFIIEGKVAIKIGTHKIIHDSTTYQVMVSSRYYDDVTEVIVQET